MITFGIKLYQRIEKENNDYIKSKEWLESDTRREMIFEQRTKPKSEALVNIALREYFQSCPGCPDVLPLTESINDIVQVLAKKEDANHPELHLLEEVGELEVILGITKYMSKPLEGGGCYTEAYCNDSFVRESVIDDSTVLLFSSPINLNELRALHFRSDLKTEYYYRATLDGYDDKVIIHLVINADGTSYMEYFSKSKHITTGPEPEVIPEPERFRIGRPEDIHGPWFGFNNENPDRYFRGHIALALELPGGGGFLERVHFLDLQNKHGNNLERFLINSDGGSLTYTRDAKIDVQAGVETNYDQFSTSLGLPQYIMAKIGTNSSFEKFDAELIFPANIHKGSFNLTGDTRLQHTIGESSVDLETNYVLDFMPSLPLSFNAQTSTTFEPGSITMNSVDFGGTLDIDPNSSVSLIFEYEHDDSPNVTLRYKLSK